MTSREGAPSADPVDVGSVTAIITLSVKPGTEVEFRSAQESLNHTAVASRGFLGAEAVAPSEGSDEWTAIYRFSSRPELEEWLSSPERQLALARLERLLSTPAAQQVLIGEDDLVSVVVTHRVDPADEGEFVAWTNRVTDAERAFHGFRGSEIFRPVPGVQENWTMIFRFDGDQHLSAWLDSPQRKQLLEEGSHFQDFELRRVASPFGNWFSFTDHDEQVEAPASWKTALSVLVGLYPTVVLLTLAITELWGDGELWATLLVGNILSVALLTWVVMPVVTGALRFWLDPLSKETGPRLDALGAAVSVAFLAFAALGFWLATTQIWHLPS